MQSLEMITVETLIQFVTDNMINIFLVFIATKFYKIKLKTTAKLWVIGQTLNLVKTFIIRYGFNGISQ